MEQKHDNRYDNSASFIDEVREKNKKRVKTSGIALIALPVVLGLIRWLTASDKTVFLIIWVIFMFLLAAYLVSVEYYEHYLYNRLTGGPASPAAEDAENAEEGGSQ